MESFDLTALTLELEKYLQVAYGMSAGIAGGALFMVKLGVLLALTFGIIYLAVILLIGN